tara:strand:+ start:307 stop:744 length:438 start_codon:yes stop_codon:yes gene_type:complete
MSSFTRRLAVAAVTSPKTGWAAMLPPGFQRPSWEVLGGFRYLVSSADAPSEIIRVPAGFVFDGASVPLPFRLLLPMAHPDYIQAAALHDWMLKSGRYTRRYCDAVFHEALGVLGLPEPWRAIMFAGVRIGAVRWHARKVLGGRND